MDNFVRRAALLSACLLTAAALTSAPVAAFARQTASPSEKTPPPPTPRELQMRVWSALLEQNKDAKPNVAIDAYKKFWEDTPDLLPFVGTRVCVTIARVYSRELKDSSNALKTCDWALTQYPKAPERIILIAYKASLLADLKRPSEVQALVEANWSLMLRSDPSVSRAMLHTYAVAMRHQLKSADAINTMAQTFRRLPIYLGDESWSAGDPLYSEIIDQLIQQENYDSALSWAKLRFLLCPYDTLAVSRALSGIQAIVKQKEMPITNIPAATSTITVMTPAGTKVVPVSPRTRRVFGEAPPQSDATESVENENGTVALPEGVSPALLARLRTIPFPSAGIDREQIQKRLSLIPGKTEEDRIERITLLLINGEFRTAMEEAKKYETDLPQSPNGPKQVARVFKAVDLDVTRANTYLVFHRTGKGVDPLPKFWKDFPESTGSEKGN